MEGGEVNEGEGQGGVGGEVPAVEEVAGDVGRGDGAGAAPFKTVGEGGVETCGEDGVEGGEEIEVFAADEGGGVLVGAGGEERLNARAVGAEVGCEVEELVHVLEVRDEEGEGWMVLGGVNWGRGERTADDQRQRCEDFGRHYDAERWGRDGGEVVKVEVKYPGM